MLSSRMPIIQEFNEPCFFDFLYEEIRQNTEIEILNTIVFESIIRTSPIKKLLNQNLSSENIFDFYFKNTNNHIISNPLQRELNNFYLGIEKFYRLIETLKLENENSISEDEFIKVFFNNDQTSYKIVLDKLREIKKILAKHILPKLNTSIKIESENISQQEDNINPFKIFEQYGLNYNEFILYSEELNNYLMKTNLSKYELLNGKNDKIGEYKNTVSKLVSEYRKFYKNQLFVGNKIFITPGKRPISKLLSILQVTIPFYIDDTTKTRLLKGIDTIKMLINETNLKSEMKKYIELTKKEYSKILTMKPEIFARTLFIYDWLEYSDNPDTYYNHLTQEEKIKYLQDIYPDLKKTKYKTLENTLNIFRNFIQHISELNISQAT